jgi:hypothetical protein
MPTPSLILVPARFKSGKLYTPVATTSGGTVLGASGDFNVTRATSATRVNANGLIESVASGIPRLDYPLGGGCPALLVEPAATNLALHSRDLTNAVWSGTTVTTTKNAVGADGTASGATTITATAASGTVLQALAHASQSRIFSAYIRRVSGTGTIQLTTNGGTNWDTVTITSGYTQVASVARTVASGTVGIRLAVSGDVIEVDYTQGEVGPVATSVIPTTTTSVTRNADVISLSGAVSGCIGQTEGTIYVELDVRSLNSGVFRRPFSLSDTTTSNLIQVFTSDSSSLLTASVITSGISQASITTASAVTGVAKIAIGYALNNVAFFVNGLQVGATDTSATIPACSAINIGASAAGGSFFNDRIRAVALYTTRLTNAQLAALTT